MGRCSAIHRCAHRKHNFSNDFQFHGFPAEDAGNTAQETQTRSPGEPGGKGSAYGAN
jgi:hypothetical protein